MLVASCAERRAIYGCGGMVQGMVAGVRWLGVWVEGAEREKNREFVVGMLEIREGAAEFLRFRAEREDGGGIKSFGEFNKKYRAGRYHLL